MGKYTKRKDGRYLTHVSTGKYDENGRAIRIPIYARTEKELDDLKADVKVALKNGTYADDKGMTLKTWSHKWIDVYKSGLSEGTYRNYKNIVYNHLKDIEDIRLKDLSKSDVQLLINKKRGAPETQRMIILTIKQILEDAIEDGLLYRNIARNIKAPKKESTNDKRALSEMEKNALKKIDLTDKERTFINILFFTGLRKGEALALTKADINVSRCEIIVNKSLSWIGGKQIKNPKTKNSNRCVNVPREFMCELEKYISSINTFNLFTMENGELMSETSFRRFWEKIYNKINEYLGGTSNKKQNGKIVEYGIKATDLTPHTFRHNYATMLYHGGIDVKEAQRLLGHSNIKTTLEIYTHLNNDKKDLSEKLSSFMVM